MDEEIAFRHSRVQEALEGLASSEVTWSLPVSSKPSKADEVVAIPEREPTGVVLLPTYGIKADVPVWGIETGDGTLDFPKGSRCQAMTGVFVFLVGRSEEETSNLKGALGKRPKNLRKKIDQGV